MSEPLFAGLDHAAIAARDPARLADWYCETLGFRPVSDNGKERPTRVLAGPGGGMIEMMPDDESPRPGRELFDSGISHLAIRVSDLDTALVRLHGAGVEVSEPVPAAGGGRVASFKDAEGNVLQVVERPAGWERT
jgi:catechol 2,3-dioxygenase-like lactoylglutathione lyase family enzyme